MVLRALFDDMRLDGAIKAGYAVSNRCRAPFLVSEANQKGCQSRSGGR